MSINAWAVEQRKRMMEQAKERQIAAAAAGGIRPTTAQEVEAARIRYHEALERALARYTGGLPGDRRGNSPLRPEERAALAEQSHGEAEIRRLAYEEVHDRYEAQERRAASEQATALTLTNIEAAEQQAQAAADQAAAAKTQAEAATTQAKESGAQSATARASMRVAWVVALVVIVQTITFVAQAMFMRDQTDLARAQLRVAQEQLQIAKAQPTPTASTLSPATGPAPSASATRGEPIAPSASASAAPSASRR